MLQKPLQAFFLFVILGAFSYSVNAAAELAESVPKFDFAPQKNAIEISSEFDSNSASWLLGAIVNINEKQIEPINYRIDGSKLKTTPIGSEKLHLFFDRNLDVSAGWLSFFKANFADNQIAKASIVQKERVSIESNELDLAKLADELKTAIPEKDRKNYGVIMSYVVYELNTELLDKVDTGAEGGVNGTKVSGDFYKHAEEASKNNRVVALWGPLELVLRKAESNQAKNLTTAVKSVETSQVSVPRAIEQPVKVETPAPQQ
jgi:hypothetical protein